MSGRVARVAVVATPAVALLVCAPWHLTRFAPPKLAVAFFGVLLAFGCLALGRPPRNDGGPGRDTGWSLHLSRWGGWALLGWGALSLTWSPDPSRGVGLWLPWLLAGLWLLLLGRVLSEHNPEGGLRRLLAWSWLGGGAVVALLALVQRAGMLRLGLHQVTATLGNPNRVAVTLVLCLPLAVLLSRREPGRVGRWAARGLALLLLAAIAATGCRAALLAVAVQVGYFCLTLRFALRVRLALVTLLVTLLLLAPTPGTELTRAAQAASGRAFIAQVSTRVISERPVHGAGLGGFPTRAAWAQGALLAERTDLRGHWSHLDDAHNQWLTVTAQLGVVGLGLLLLWLLPVLWLLTRRRTEVWARHALAAWIGLGVCAVTETVLLSVAVVLLAFGWLALGSGAMPAVAQPGRWPGRLRFAIPLVLALGGATLATSQLLAHYQLGQGMRRLDQHPVQRAHFEAAARHYGRGLVQVGVASELRFQRGLARRELGDLVGAAEDLRVAYRLRPSPDRAVLLGDLCLGRGDVRRAISWYGRALRLHPRYQRAYNNLGVALLRVGQRARACRHLVRARSLRPGDRTARGNHRAHCSRRAQAAR